MDVRVLALDYDGTIASSGVLHPDVRAAIHHVRASGLAVILVTGRRLDDLRGATGDLRFVDAVVAENGALLAFPESGRSLPLAEPASRQLLTSLHARGVSATAGECLIDADASSAHDILSAIRELELPLTLLFNRGRVMVLPQGHSKATGLLAMLRALRLSQHNALAIGDAENDHALLEVCEAGVAVGWGSPALKAVADHVLEGEYPAAVATFIRAVRKQPPDWPGKSGRHQLTLGRTADGQPISLAVRNRNVLIVGDPRSGKSWVAGLLAEQLILQGYSVCVIDPEGDYAPLRMLPGVLTLGDGASPPTPRDVWQALGHADVSLVVDISRLAHDEKRAYVGTLLPVLAAMRRRNGIPHRILLDEAHYYLGDDSDPLPPELHDSGLTLVTYRLSQLSPRVRAASDVVLATRLTAPDDAVMLLPMAGASAVRDDWRNTLAHLSLREAALLPGADEARGQLVTFTVTPRITPHVRHREKYADVPVPEQRAFVFTLDGLPTGHVARTLAQFVAHLQHCADPVLDGHLRRGDVSSWISRVFGDQSLASTIQDIEALWSLGQIANPRDAIAQRIQDRYRLGEAAVP